MAPTRRCRLEWAAMIRLQAEKNHFRQAVLSSIAWLSLGLLFGIFLCITKAMLSPVTLLYLHPASKIRKASELLNVQGWSSGLRLPHRLPRWEEPQCRQPRLAVSCLVNLGVALLFLWDVLPKSISCHFVKWWRQTPNSVIQTELLPSATSTQLNYLHFISHGFEFASESESVWWSPNLSKPEPVVPWITEAGCGLVADLAMFSQCPGCDRIDISNVSNQAWAARPRAQVGHTWSSGAGIASVGIASVCPSATRSSAQSSSLLAWR